MPGQILHYFLIQKVLVFLFILKRLDKLLSQINTNNSLGRLKTQNSPLSTLNSYTLTYPNGVTTNYSYDSTGRLLEILSQVVSYRYTYDGVGNRLSKTEEDKRYDYAYDKIYRLLQPLPTKLQGNDKEQENKTEAFTYDPVGNRLKKLK